MIRAAHQVQYGNVYEVVAAHRLYLHCIMQCYENNRFVKVVLIHFIHCIIIIIQIKNYCNNNNNKWSSVRELVYISGDKRSRELLQHRRNTNMYGFNPKSVDASIQDQESTLHDYIPRATELFACG